MKKETSNIRDKEYECIYNDSNSNSNNDNDKKREKGKRGEINNNERDMSKDDNNNERDMKKSNLSSKINKGGGTGVIGLYLNSIKKGLTTPTLPE